MKSNIDKDFFDYTLRNLIHRYGILDRSHLNGQCQKDFDTFRLWRVFLQFLSFILLTNFPQPYFLKQRTDILCINRSLFVGKRTCKGRDYLMVLLETICLSYDM